MSKQHCLGQMNLKIELGLSHVDVGSIDIVPMILNPIVVVGSSEWDTSSYLRLMDQSTRDRLQTVTLVLMEVWKK